MLQSCSSGLYGRLDSTSPNFGPVLIGMTRAEAEMRLGDPIYVSRLDDNRYRAIYKYEVKPKAFDQLCVDVLDFTTFGMGNLIVGPIDRFKGSSHLMSVVYEIKGDCQDNDVITDIKSKIRIVEK